MGERRKKNVKCKKQKSKIGILQRDFLEIFYCNILEHETIATESYE